MIDYGLDLGNHASQGEVSPRLLLMDYFPLEQMQTLQDLFAKTHRLAVVITDLDGNWITRPSNFSTLCLILQGSEKVKERCDLTYKVLGESLLDSGKLIWQECLNCGLVEAGIPIWTNGEHVANCLVGQNNALNVSRQRAEEFAWLMEVDVFQVRNAFAEMPNLPIEQFSKVLTLFSGYASEVNEQAYRSHRLQIEINRLRQVETTLRQEGIELLQTSAVLRESINRIGRNLQEVLRMVNEMTDEQDHFKLSGPAEQVKTVLESLTQKIRQTYRTVLDGMALEQAQRKEMEKLLFGNRPGMQRRRLSRQRVDSPPPASPKEPLVESSENNMKQKAGSD